MKNFQAHFVIFGQFERENKKKPLKKGLLLCDSYTAGTTLIALSFALFLGSGSVSNVTF